MSLDRSSTSKWLTPLTGAVVVLAGAIALAAPGCADENDPGQPAGSAGAMGTDGGSCGGPVPSTGADDHCVGTDGGKIVEPATECIMGGDSGTVEVDGGETLPPPHDGTEADDDDCKFHVTYSAACAAGGVNFTVTPTLLGDMSKATGADPYIEAFLTDIHPAPSSGTATESDGVYTIGPVKFDQSGKWTVRFHFYPTCDDTEGSKHAHVAFFFNVP